MKKIVLFTLAALAIVALSLGSSSVEAGSLTVNNTANAGPMTLRHAIESANSNPGADVINFDPAVFPPGSPATISLTTALPEIDGSDGVTIDGSGAGVIIDGSGLTGSEDGLVITGSGALSEVTLRNLTVRDFPGGGINFCGGGLPDCDRDVTNLDILGVESTDNGGNGITFSGKAIREIHLQGCTATMNGGFGMYMDATGDANDVQLTGCTSEGNGNMGLFLQSEANIIDFALIGGSFSNNHGIGAYLDAVEDTVRPRIEDVVATGNTQMGVGFSSAGPLTDLMFIDSTIDGNGSLSGGGIGSEVLAFEIVDATVTGNSFNNNIANFPVVGIGFQIYSQFERPSNLTITDNTFNGNVGTGLSIITDTDGRPPAHGLIANNEASGNGADGISIYRSGPVTISRNRTFANQKIGINLKGGEEEEDQTGVTLNDPGDNDTGPNNLLNFPVLTSFSGSVVQGTACSNCTIELFRADDDPTGHGEGQTFLAEGTASGGAFSILVSGLCAGDLVTATATDSAGNTSEFSLNLEVPDGLEGCGAGAVWGDNTCEGSVTLGDAIGLARFLVSLPVNQEEGCPVIGEGVTVNGIQRPWGDANCSSAVNLGDAIAIARFLVSLSVDRPAECPVIGATVVLES